ncbi:hypothetical protein ABEF92_006993 [Exophiala dermatitidis]|uniref:BRCT domain-containing protein n=1 Tax=Exophiala dermatitidis (strain ATCC 34100 / CBS 525.76 / NIH/UT8656) TaxID=858893 RepID=H6BJW2_EXODN|nr:uncharacterized protein HMPREF1120_00546 [Exophiala dermatitidis NIH/UT8656]EHY52332.1 hypothetical protein HMPREF1120_00546 [Exophiala dermatitidis NIH/UT8656]
MAPRRAAASPAKPRRVTRARAADAETTMAVEEPPKRKTSAAAARNTTAASRAKTSRTTSATEAAATTTSRTRTTRSAPTTTTSAMPTTTRTKSLEAKSRVTKKTESKPSRATRGTKSTARISNVAAALETIESGDEEDEIALTTVSEPATKTARSTRTTGKASTSALAAAPRRRIKITPLDSTTTESTAAPAAEPEAKPEKKTSTKAKTDKTAASKPPTTRRKRDAAAAQLEDEGGEVVTEQEPKPRGRGRGRTVAAPAENQPAAAKASTAGAKPRGRPRKEPAVAEPPQESKPAVAVRQTRARAGSNNSSVPADPPVQVVVPPKKKVTFQDPPSSEDEKENKHPATLAKSKTVKKASATAKKTETATKGMRAKPIRNPAASKTTRTARGAAAKASTQVEQKESSKVLPRVLTPKKITQVAKAQPMDSEDEEDELAGEKTPVRDLSLSPRRGIIPSMPRSASPVKKLDFTPALNATSPEKPSGSPGVGIISPPRRMPASPLKDSLKESPRRAPEGITVFRAQIQDNNNPGSVNLHPSSNQAMLQQSPKRGLADKIIFPPSAAKSHNSPSKRALLSSPARRLFSPLKQKTPARASPSPKKKSPQQDESPSCGGKSKSPGDVDLVMSSHFRSSVSPQRLARIYRLSDDELAQEANQDIDFDRSVLSVRSPLKVDKSEPRVAGALQTFDLGLPVEHGHVEQDHGLAFAESSDVEDGESSVPNELKVSEQEEASAAGAPDHPADPDHDNDETIVDPTVEEGDDDDEETVEAAQEAPSPASVSESSHEQPTSTRSFKRPRLSNALFTRIRDNNEDSGDELAADQTPANRLLKPNFRPSLTGANIRSRLSAGITPSPGFTPLVEQVRGWHAASPEKRVLDQESKSFSPLARMHVEGSIEVNRQGTPVRQAQKRKSLASRLSFAPSMVGSPAQPEFFAESMEAKAFEEQSESRDVPVDGHDEEDLHDLVQQDALGPSAGIAGDNVQDHNDLDDEGQDGSGSESVEQREPGDLTTDLINFTKASDTAMVDFQALADEAENLAGQDQDGEDEGQEASNVLQESGSGPSLERVDEEEDQSVLSTSSDMYDDENLAPVPGSAAEVVDQPDVGSDSAQVLVDMSTHETTEGQPEGDQVDDRQPDEVPTTEVHTSPSTMALTSVEAPAEMDFNVTPIRPDPSLPRYVHTVSKVPLRPEGQLPSVLSPLKAMRKRPRSMSSSNSLATAGVTFLGNKRRSLGDGSGLDIMSTADASQHLGIPSSDPAVPTSSPQRRIRSAAPSPAHSLASHLTTPGQMSFTVEDFGDSTLDGIELPSDELSGDEVDMDESRSVVEVGHTMAEEDVDEDSMMTIGSAMFKTPTVPTQRRSLVGAVSSTAKSVRTATPRSTRSIKSNVAATPRQAMTAKSSGTATATASATPHYAMSTVSSKRRSLATSVNLTPSRRMTASGAAAAARTPATVGSTSNAAKTPTTTNTLLKSKSAAASAAKTSQTHDRAPLNTVGNILNGAVVHYDIHTTEGQDASGVFVELLTAMGARCVKEWKWNPRSTARASMPALGSAAGHDSGLLSNPGVTHVVYKDGGKRTLEKVRSANGSVLCVGVGWVLDCYREGKWLDEAAYAVDSSVLPRGGSRRRKSMEPRMLQQLQDHEKAYGTQQANGKRHNRRVTLADLAHLPHGSSSVKSKLTEAMKMDLINTPVRGMEEQQQRPVPEPEHAQVDADGQQSFLNEDGHVFGVVNAEAESSSVNEDSEMLDYDVVEVGETSFGASVSVSTADDDYDDGTFGQNGGYGTPTATATATMATIGGETRNVNLITVDGFGSFEQQRDQNENEDDEEVGGSSILLNTAYTPLPLSRTTTKRNISTPESACLNVDYDPRTAATPITPYFAAKCNIKEQDVPQTAPAKQMNKGLFENDDDNNDGEEDDGNGRNQKFQVKSRSKNGDAKADGGLGGNGPSRRKTLAGANLRRLPRGSVGLGFKPVVASPLRKD